MRYWHITISSGNRLRIFGSEASRRMAVWTLIRVLGEALVIFCIVDDHVHVVVVCVEEQLPRLRTALWHALEPLTDVPLSRPFPKPVESRLHLERLVRYCLTQTDHHGLSESLLLYSGSCYQDLVGAWLVEGWQTRLFRALPRWREADLHRIVGLSPPGLRPASDDAIRAAGAAQVAFAASMSAAADPRMRGNGARVVLARSVAARLASAVGIGRAEMSWALDVTPRALRRIEERPVDPRQTEAARRCIALIDRACPEAASFRLVPRSRAAS